MSICLMSRSSKLQLLTTINHLGKGVKRKFLYQINVVLHSSMGIGGIRTVLVQKLFVKFQNCAIKTVFHHPVFETSS